jgi:hypothetical protein
LLYLFINFHVCCLGVYIIFYNHNTRCIS